MIMCSTQDTTSRARPPAPAEHAAALIRDFGYDTALELARDYCDGYSRSEYWSAVRQHVERLRRRRDSTGKSSPEI